jgi:hypothetical protein
VRALRACLPKHPLKSQMTQTGAIVNSTSAAASAATGRAYP